MRSLPAGAFAVSLVIAGACSGRSPLTPIVTVRPEISSLTVATSYTAWPEDGILAVYGALAEPSPGLEDNERIPVAITVSSGDSEQILMESPYISQSPRARTLISVLMRPGHTVDELDDIVEQIPARWWLVSSSARTTGSIRVFDSRLVDGAIRALRQQPGVQEAERDPIGFAGDPPNLALQLFAAAPLDYGQASRGDGSVQGQSGDTIVVKYQQPDGSVITTSSMMQ